MFSLYRISNEQNRAEFGNQLLCRFCYIIKPGKLTSVLTLTKAKTSLSRWQLLTYYCLLDDSPTLRSRPMLHIFLIVPLRELCFRGNGDESSKIQTSLCFGTPGEIRKRPTDTYHLCLAPLMDLHNMRLFLEGLMLGKSVKEMLSWRCLSFEGNYSRKEKRKNNHMVRRWNRPDAPKDLRSVTSVSIIRVLWWRWYLLSRLFSSEWEQWLTDCIYHK